MVILAHITIKSRLCLGSYGGPRMTEELKKLISLLTIVAWGAFDKNDLLGCFLILLTIFETIKAELIWRIHGDAQASRAATTQQLD